MNTRALRSNTFTSRSWTTLIAGSLLIASCQAAQAGPGEMKFREFRQQNQGLAKHAARRLFQAEVKNSPRVDQGEFHILPYPYPIEDGGRRGGNEIPKIEKLNDRIQMQALRTQTIQQSNETGQFVRMNSGINLDLTSGTRNITLGKNLFREIGSVEIKAGGQTKTLGAGSTVSAAEYIAVKQVLSGGGQKLSLNKAGTATGGEVDLDAITGNNDVMRARDFVVSDNVTTYGDFGKRSDFRVLGDLNNYGTIHVTSSDNNVRSGAIRADDINNYNGGTISSKVDLTLDAAGDLNNEGTIVSEGALTLLAAGAVNNNGALCAQQNLNVVSSQINNHGTVESSTANVNLDGSALAALYVDNTKGAISALQGAINVRNAAFGGAFDTQVGGGDLISRELNLNSGQGLMEVSVNKLTGVINETGAAAHVMATTDVLNIGEICLTGDPTFYNTLGSINIIADVTVPENLVIVAAGNIIMNAGVDIVAPGFDVNLIAGAAFVPQGGSDQTDIGPVPPIVNNGGVSISGKKSKTGGFIQMNATSTISTQSATNGGDIVLAAFAGKGLGSGIIDIQNGELRAGGSSGDNGNITLFASSKEKAVPVIATGLLDNSGGNLFTGLIQINVGPITTVGGDVVYNPDGSLASLSALTNKGVNKDAVVLVVQYAAGADINAGGEIEFNTGGDLVIEGDVLATGEINIDIAAGRVTTAPGAGPVTASDVNINSAASLGDLLGDPFKISANFLQIDFDAGVTEANVQVSGVGNFTLGDARVDNELKIDASGIQFDSGGPVVGSVVDFTANGFNGLQDIDAKEAFRLRAQSGDLSSDIFNGRVTTPKLSLFADAGSVQINSVVPFDVPAGVKELVIVEASNDVRIECDSAKEVKISEVTAGSAVEIRSQNSLELGKIISGSGIVDIEIEDGTLTVTDDIEATDGVRLFVDQLAQKGKISLESGVTISTNSSTSGNVDISVGVPSLDPFVPNPNVFDVIEINGGSIIFTGAAGVKASKGPIFLTADGADINVNNGTGKSANLSMGPSLGISVEF